MIKPEMNPVFIIIALNVGGLIAAYISPDLLYDLGMYAPMELFIRHPWGIFTSLFLHDGFFHLFANMITLFFFGSFLLRLIGDKKLLLIYLGGGIIGNIFFLLLGTLIWPDSAALAVGASGAVFALGGTLTVMVPKLKVFVFPIPAPIPLWIAVIGGFIILSFIPYVAWEAHLGGLLFGIIAGLFFKRSGRRQYYV